MSDIAELEKRIGQALGRIRDGLASQQGGGDSAALETQLAEEKMANAQLQERVASLNERVGAASQALEEKVAAQAAEIAALMEESQKLRAANADLQDVAGRLRAEAMEGASPELINRALLAEVDALKARRAADANDLEAVLAELKPLIAEA